MFLVVINLLFSTGVTICLPVIYFGPVVPRKTFKIWATYIFYWRVLYDVQDNDITGLRKSCGGVYVIVSPLVDVHGIVVTNIEIYQGRN